MTRDELIAAVPIREFRGRPFYVRIRDIPAPWDAQFSRALYGANCPGFADEGPCAHSHDWESWVNGRWWGGATVPIGLDPDPAHIAYVCNAVRAPEFDTNRAKLLICIGSASRLPLQQAQLGVLLGFLDLECSQHIRLALGD